MKRSILLAEFFDTIWAIHPAALHKATSVMENWANGIQPSAEVLTSIAQDIEARAVQRQAAVNAGGGGIAVLPLYGIMTQRGNMVNDISGPGSCSTQQFTQALRAAVADPSIGQVLIDIDSPGGSVFGTSELADEIYSARATKPVVCIANSLAASAAYWIGSSCSEFYCTPGGEVGSIGVYTAHKDMSKAMENDGVNVTLISAGKNKTLGNPFQPLDEEARASIQQSVDNYYAMFTKAVSRGRGVPISAVRDGMGQGKCLSASDALAQNMIDGVMTFDQVVSKMQKSMRTSRGVNAETIVPEVVAEQAEAIDATTTETAPIFDHSARRRELELMQ